MTRRLPTEHLTPETQAIVDALRKHRDALNTLLETEQVGTPQLHPSIIRVLGRAITRLVLLDTRLESLKRRKPDTTGGHGPSLDSTAADEGERE